MTAPDVTSHQVSPNAWLQRCDNPGPMTLDGTNTWLLASSDTPQQLVVIDPGPEDEAHLQAVAEHAESRGATIVLGLLTHGHLDHSGGIGRFTELTAAPVRRLPGGEEATGFASLGIELDTEPLRDGELIEVGALRLQVVTTPGHTTDSVCFVDVDELAMYTGDTILGRGTTVVAHPDGVLESYLQSLRRIAGMVEDGQVERLHPAHGPVLPDAGATVAHYLQHRQQRLDQVRAAMSALEPGLDPDDRADRIVLDVYADVPREVWPAAKRTVLAQLEYLLGRES